MPRPAPTAREVPEWIGAHPDAAIPPRVKLRLLEKHGHACALCRVPFDAKRCPEFDHAIPLILGGLHGEANLRPLCAPCHAGKSAADVKLKAKVARVAKKHRGVAPKSHRSFPTNRDGRWKAKIGGTVERRGD